MRSLATRPVVVWDRIIGSNNRHRAHFESWAAAVYRETRGRLAHVRAVSITCGTANRAAALRRSNRELAAFEFDPEADLRLGSEGCGVECQPARIAPVGSRVFWDRAMLKTRFKAQSCLDDPNTLLPTGAIGPVAIPLPAAFDPNRRSASGSNSNAATRDFDLRNALRGFAVHK